MEFPSLAALATLVVLGGCSTPYQEMGLLGGVSSTQIDGNTINVTAHGNGFTSASTIKNYTILKSADETVALGFDYFAMGNEADESQHGMMSFSSGSVYSNSWFGSGFSTETIKPGETVIVKMYHGQKPENAPPNYFDAHEVENYLGKLVKGTAALESRPNLAAAAPQPAPAASSDMKPYVPAGGQSTN